jgi:hypothetical protein
MAIASTYKTEILWMDVVVPHNCRNNEKLLKLSFSEGNEQYRGAFKVATKKFHGNFEAENYVTY